MNWAHRWLGRILFFVTTLHVIAYLAIFAQTHTMKSEMSKSANILASIGYSGFCLIFFSSIGYVRRHWWHLFKICHHFGIFLFVVGVRISLSSHQSTWSRCIHNLFQSSSIITRGYSDPGSLFASRSSASQLYSAFSPPACTLHTSQRFPTQSQQSYTFRASDPGGFPDSLFAYGYSLEAWV